MLGKHLFLGRKLHQEKAYAVQLNADLAYKGAIVARKDLGEKINKEQYRTPLKSGTRRAVMSLKTSLGRSKRTNMAKYWKQMTKLYR